MAAHRIGFCFLVMTTACTSAVNTRSRAANALPADETTVEVTYVERVVLEEDPSDGTEDAQQPDFAVTRTPGDYFVYRIGGSFAERPMTLTERVLSKDKDILVMEFSLEDGRKKETLRVTMDAKSGGVDSVSALEAGRERPVDRAAYTRLLARTELVPERNDDMVSSKESACMLGEDPVHCSITTYRVSVRGEDAILKISASDEVVDRDIGGEIIDPNGKVLYSARLVERGSEAPDPVARVGLVEENPYTKRMRR